MPFPRYFDISKMSTYVSHLVNLNEGMLRLPSPHQKDIMMEFHQHSKHYDYEYRDVYQKPFTLLHEYRSGYISK